MRSEAKDAAKDELKVSESIKPCKLWNPDIALRRMGADTDLLCTMVDYFLEDSLLLLLDLRQRISAGDALEASRVAHSLKGLCSNFEAEAATRAGAAVEAACMAATLQEASSLIPTLAEQLSQLSHALMEWKESHSPGAG
jgi:HPt (histidine-containing phosphotransfer) domain-containing protein